MRPPLLHTRARPTSGLLGLYALVGMFASSGVGAFAGYTVGQVAPAGHPKSEALRGKLACFRSETVLRN
jgi:hypothetical protein